MKPTFLSALILATALPSMAFADDMSRMLDSMRQMQGAVAPGGRQVDAPPPGFFTGGRDSAPPAFWDNSSGESNDQQFQRNMSGITRGVRSAGDMAEDGRKAAEAADQVRGNGGVDYQNRGQGTSRVAVDGRAVTSGRGNRSEVIINGKRYYTED